MRTTKQNKKGDSQELRKKDKKESRESKKRRLLNKLTREDRV